MEPQESLSPSPAPIPVQPNSPVEPSSPPVISNPNDTPKQPRSKKPFYFILGGGILLLILIAIIIGVVIFKSQQANPNPSVNPDSPSQNQDDSASDRNAADVPESFEFTIFDDSVPGGSTTISVKGNQVTVEEYDACSAVDCEGSTDENTYEFSDENVVKLYEFYESELADHVEESLDNGGHGEIFQSSLDNYQSRVFYALLLGEDQFAHDVQKLSYQIYVKPSDSDNYSYQIYQINVPENGTPYVINTILEDDLTYDYYDLDFSDKNLEIIANFTEELSEETSKKDRNPVFSIDYVDATPKQKTILDAIIENDESKIESR